MHTPFLTLVIPAYNEEKRLPHSLELIGNFLRCQPYCSEVIVVENGSIDGTSGVVESYAATVSSSDPFSVRLLHSAQGKGIAVKTGMLMGRGDYRFICDADLSMPIEEIVKFLPPCLKPGSYDIAIASRELPGSVRHNEPLYRHLMGRIFNFIVRASIIPGIEDTQCGFKCFTREAAAQIFPYQTISGWGFDPEILYISRLRGLRLMEVPIDWYYTPESRINPARDAMKMLREIFRVRQNSKRGIYNLATNPITVDCQLLLE